MNEQNFDEVNNPAGLPLEVRQALSEVEEQTLAGFEDKGEAMHYLFHKAIEMAVFGVDEEFKLVIFDIQSGHYVYALQGSLGSGW